MITHCLSIISVNPPHPLKNEYYEIGVHESPKPHQGRVSLNPVSHQVGEEPSRQIPVEGKKYSDTREVSATLGKGELSLKVS